MVGRNTTMDIRKPIESSAINRVFGLVCLALSLIVCDSIAASPAERETAEQSPVATKTEPGRKMFTARYNTPVDELVGKLEGLATRLASKQIREGGEVDGPLHILIESGAADSGKDEETLLAFPTSGNPRSSGRYRSISTKPFRCVYRSYEGPAEGISTVMAELARETEETGHQLNGQARLVLSCDGNCTREHMMLELQLGID